VVIDLFTVGSVSEKNGRTKEGGLPGRAIGAINPQVQLGTVFNVTLLGD
jgi:hypothetical protein